MAARVRYVNWVLQARLCSDCAKHWSVRIRSSRYSKMLNIIVSLYPASRLSKNVVAHQHMAQCVPFSSWSTSELPL